MINYLAEALHDKWKQQHSRAIVSQAAEEQERLAIENASLRKQLLESKQEVSRLFFDATLVRREMQQEISSFRSTKQKLAQLEQENGRLN